MSGDFICGWESTTTVLRNSPGARKRAGARDFVSYGGGRYVHAVDPKRTDASLCDRPIQHIDIEWKWPRRMPHQMLCRDCVAITGQS